MLIDHSARLTASDPEKSYIVQAPAGSGKTELLTQRYLRLLSRVSTPEQIIALTFTRKAAAEMRERIIKALELGQQNTETLNDHQQLTQTYAKNALASNAKYKWNILEHTQRLKIITIDALCQSLADAIPFSEKYAPFAEISEKPEQLYEQTVHSCIEHMLSDSGWHDDLSALMLHLDNQQDRLVELLSTFLSRRDQWLSVLYSSKEQSKEQLEYAFSVIENYSVKQLKEAIDSTTWEYLRTLSQQLVCIENNENSPRYALSHWQNHNDLTRVHASALSQLLLTKDGKLRKSFDHHVGLKKGVCADSLYRQLKDSSKELLTVLATNEGFSKALQRIKELPTPAYPAAQWQILQVLLRILPLLVAHLYVVFKAENQVDFVALAEQAIFALGSEDEPTDLNLHMDNSIHHLLIDEFQDTSLTQFTLVSRLVNGWQADDGKTLFIVGDPMQSIYRFRQAEVGLFLRAKQQGIGPVRLDFLELKTNFRSSEFLVEWVNAQFKTIFPIADSMEAGAVSFHESIAFKSDNRNSMLRACALGNKTQEAQFIVDSAIEQLDRFPEDTVAILVRSRAHLKAIIPQLRARNIPFQGVEIERLSTLEHLQDIWTLVQALVTPADRIAWLAFLRSPWAGITLEDILSVASFAPKKSIYYSLSHLSTISALSAEGRTRLQYVFSVLQSALQRRHQQSFTSWVIAIVNQLHNEIVLDAQQKNDLEQFWLLLSQFTSNGQIFDTAKFAQQFEKLYSTNANSARLQIMTIHKSKGLEFDCVILPGLGAKTQKQTQSLLRWLNFSDEQENLLLISPIRSALQSHCDWYDFIGTLQSEKEAYEQQRLLYVAVTRARQRLILTDCHEKTTSNTSRSLLTQEFITEVAEVAEVHLEQGTPECNFLAYLPIDYYQHPIESLSETSVNKLPPSSSYNERQFGIVAHKLLQWIGHNNPTRCDELPWEFMHNQFKSLGFTKLVQMELMIRLQSVIENMFHDKIGNWLWKPHKDNHCELSFITTVDDKIQTNIIDRTFISNRIRWVVDYKTGAEDKNTEASHREQLNNYARLYETEPHNIRCGIYYLSSSHWVSWSFKE